MLGLLTVMAMATACTVNTTNAGADAAPPGPDAGPIDDGGAPTGALGFTPSNVDLTGIDLTKVGDFVVDADCTIDTDSNLASCGDGAQVLAFKIATQSDGSKVAVYVAKSLTIPAGKSLTIQGFSESRPLVLIALETITIAGSLDGSSKAEVGIAGGSSPKTEKTKGVGPGGGSASGALAASGGGSYCGIGGGGAAETGGTATLGGTAYGTPAITPLVAGSSGGDVGSGAGGGAIQLVAGKTITIEASGKINVGAGGGGFGGISTQEAKGGGSGGSILLESLAVTVAGTLAANGGGAGAGTSSDVGAPPPNDPSGANATADATAAAGGKLGVGPSSGGSGSAGTTIDGAAGSFTPNTASTNNAAGGGGGGAGRIRINTKSGQATLGGVISPAASSTCTTQGTVRP
jgi:hypothetical protein